MNNLQRFIYYFKKEYRRDWGNLFEIIKFAYLKRNEETYIEHNDRTENFCITIVQSPQWRKWDKVAHLRGWDTAESAECGWLSKKHLQAFFKFVIEKNQEDTLKEIGICMDKVKNK